MGSGKKGSPSPPRQSGESALVGPNVPGGRRARDAPPAQHNHSPQGPGQYDTDDAVTRKKERSHKIPSSERFSAKDTSSYQHSHTDTPGPGVHQSLELSDKDGRRNTKKSMTMDSGEKDRFESPNSYFKKGGVPGPGHTDDPTNRSGEKANQRMGGNSMKRGGDRLGGPDGIYSAAKGADSPGVGHYYRGGGGTTSPSTSISPPGGSLAKKGDARSSSPGSLMYKKKKKKPKDLMSPTGQVKNRKATEQVPMSKSSSMPSLGMRKDDATDKHGRHGTGHKHGTSLLPGFHREWHNNSLDATYEAPGGAFEKAGVGGGRRVHGGGLNHGKGLNNNNSGGAEVERSKAKLIAQLNEKRKTLADMLSMEADMNRERVAEFNEKKKRGISKLKAVVKLNAAGIFAAARSGKVNVDQETASGASPLYVACKAGQIDKVKALVKSGANVNWCTEEEERTALHVAAQKGHTAVVEVLIKKGKANVSVKDKQGQMPGDLAAEAKHKDCVKLLPVTKKSWFGSSKKK